MTHRLYLDWNSTSPLLPAVRDAMARALDDVPGNASSIHQDGQRARATVERARRAVARAIDAPPQAVVFTGGATEGNNHVLTTHARFTQEPYILCSAVEHPSVLEVVEELGRRGGVRVDVIPVDRRGRLDMEWLEQRLRAERVTLVSVMWANNETGNVYDTAALAALAHAHGAKMHVDATQALGRIPCSFAACGAEYLTLSFHKTGGPKGVGAIAVKEGVVLEAMMAGGHQERGRRPGTENVLALTGVLALCDEVTKHGTQWAEDMERGRRLALKVLEREGAEFVVRGDEEARLPNTLNVALDGVGGEDLLVALDLEGLSVSSGSACTAGSLEPSHVIMAMGYEPEDAKRSVRISLGPTTTPGVVEQAMVRVAQAARKMSAW
ncbi:MAG: cysteine desulfurase family protein [Myxococcota bacterium]